MTDVLRRHPRRRSVLLAGGATGVLVTACALSGCLGGAADYSAADSPQPGPVALRPGVAWVFSSGGPRGLIHIGVLKALTELGLQPNLVMGSSIGALVATLYAAGLPMARIEALALDVDVMDIVRPQLGGDEWLNTAGLARWVDALAGHRLLEQMQVPLAVVALNVATRQSTVFTRGRTGLALQAACSIEGRFEPVGLRGQRYVDADLVVPMPVRLAQGLGVVRVLAVDASAHEDKAPAGTESWRAGDLRKRALTVPDAQAAALTLHPDAGYYAGMRRAWREMAIRSGYEQTLTQAGALRALHAL